MAKAAILFLVGAVCLDAGQVSHEILIPGGRDALAFVARGKQGSLPQQFLADYCRAIIENTGSDNARVNSAYVQRLAQYFRRLAALEVVGVRSGARLTVTLSFEQGRPQGPTAQILDLLGWRIRALEKRARIQADERSATGRRQESAAALNIDGVALQQAFEQSKPFSFDLIQESAAVVLDEPTWRREFYAKSNPAGGLAEALARDRRLAKAYVGLSALDSGTLAALVRAAGLRELVEKYAALLYRYSSALVVENGRVAVPGGTAAEPYWDKLAGASPSQPESFLRALLDTRGGHLFAFFFNVSQFDRAHRHFATATATRLAGLYQIFLDDPDTHLGAAREIRGEPLMGLLREISLDAAGKVVFPGEIAVWNDGQAGATEDDVLAGLAHTRVRWKNNFHSELESLLAAMRIDTLRPERLDARSAALLRQHYREAALTYPYFEILTRLGRREYEAFFAAAAKIAHYPAGELNLAMGQLHALIEILCLAQQSGSLSDREAAELFGRLCESLAKPESLGDLSGATLDFIRRLVQGRGSNPDEAMRDLVLGRAQPVTFELEGRTYHLDAGAARRARYQRVLDMQKVPALAALLDAGEASRLPHVPLPGGKLPAAQRRYLEAFDPSRIGNAGDRLRALGPQVTLALAGIVYARFLGPEDLLVSEDPLLLRKHQYVAAGWKNDEGLFPLTEVMMGNATTGSYMAGGFANFSVIAGRLAAADGREGHVAMVVDAQMAALRDPGRRPPSDEDLRRLGERIRAARDWITRSAHESSLASDLTEATLGLLPPSRRKALLDGIRAGNWPAVWQSVTLSDLYRIGAQRIAGGERCEPWLGCTSLAPYENYERYMDPGRVAARAAELHLYLVDWMDRGRVPAAAFGGIAEPVARTVLQKLQMSDRHDWRSVLAAFQKIDSATIQEALSKP